MKKNRFFFNKNSMGFVKPLILLLTLTALLFGFFSYRSFTTARWGMAECLRWQGAELSERFIIDEKISSGLNSILQEFAGQIESGSVSSLKGFAVLRALYGGPVMLAMLHTSINNRLQTMEIAGLSDIQSLTAASLRFFMLVKDGKIADEDWEKVKHQLMEKKFRKTLSNSGTTIPETIETFKKEIDQDSLLSCLALMVRASKDATIMPENASLDSIEELKNVVMAANRAE